MQYGVEVVKRERCDSVSGSGAEDKLMSPIARRRRVSHCKRVEGAEAEMLDCNRGRGIHRIRICAIFRLPRAV